MTSIYGDQRHNQSKERLASSPDTVFALATFDVVEMCCKNMAQKMSVFWNFGPGRVWGNDEGLSPFVLVLTLIGDWSAAWSACFCKGMLPLGSSTPLTNCESVRPRHTQRGNRRRVIEPYSSRLCVKITRFLATDRRALLPDFLVQEAQVGDGSVHFY